jgi:hypothetical protein
VTSITEIADAVVTALNGHTFSQLFIAQRGYRPLFDLAEMKDLHVTVVPRGLSLTDASRSAMQRDVEIDVAVQQKPADLEQATLDALVGLVGEIVEFFARKRLAGVPAICMGLANSPIYSPEHLEQFRQFTSVVTLTLRVIE